MTVLLVLLLLAVVLGSIVLGRRKARAMTSCLSRPDRCGVTPPGRLIVDGVIFDPDRLRRAVE